MSNHFHAWQKVAQKAKNDERLQMPSFHSSFRNRKEDEWIDGFMRGLESEQIIAEVIDASASRSSMFNEEEENNNDLLMDSLEKWIDKVMFQNIKKEMSLFLRIMQMLTTLFLRRMKMQNSLYLLLTSLRPEKNQAMTITRSRT